MRFTIERMRTMVLAAGILLLVALGVFLGIAKFRRPLNVRELPKRLGIDIQQEANGVTYSHSLGAHSQYKIHASKSVQLKDGLVQLHDVKIELYGEDGSRVDRIEGGEFEYDPKSGKAVAAGPVEITLMRPGVAPAIAPKAIPDKGVSQIVKIKPLATAAETVATGEVQVKTSGLTFDWHTGVTTTSRHVAFSTLQGSGSSMGATYDSQQGILVLDRQVELTTRRGDDTVDIHAQHAVFERNDMACSLSGASANLGNGKATANEATVLFRTDGSAAQMDVTNGFTMTSSSGAHVEAPKGKLDFDERSQPRHGHLEGGVRMDSVSDDRQMHGTAPTAELDFTRQGQLSHAHLERGVEMRSEQVSQAAANPKSMTSAGLLRVSRTWHSPVADVTFHDAGHGRMTPASIHGSGGVAIAGLSQRGNAAPAPSKLAADEVTGAFGPDSSLTSMIGVGHAAIEETTATGDTQTASGDRLEAHFDARAGTDTQIQSAVLDGHVLLIQRPATNAGARAQEPLRATSGHAVYEGAGKWLHLTSSPRVTDGAMQLTAEKVDVSQDSGDAFAHGNVKATWLENDKQAQTSASGSNAAQQTLSLGGHGPAHAVSDDAQISRGSGEATFKGHARLWQQANSIAGPTIVINRGKRTLVARSAGHADPVRAVLLSAEGLGNDPTMGKTAGARTSGPSVVRVRGGELEYFDAERRALIVGGTLGAVTAETGAATSFSDQVELFLVPAGQSASSANGQGQVDRMTAAGHVVVSSEGRRGTGELLTYSSRTGEYALTGTAATPPRLVDSVRGSVTGEALIFHSRDDSVSIEGGGRTTRTETTVSRGLSKREQQN